MPIYSINKKAKFNYTILDTFEAGIVLAGHEVKSIKESTVNLKGSYITIDNNHEVWIHGAHIAHYKKATSIQDYDPYQKRKLLLNKSEINKLIGKLAQKGLTIIPISMYSKGNKIKIEIALATGKKKVDKRADIKKRDIQRDTERSLKNF